MTVKYGNSNGLERKSKIINKRTKKATGDLLNQEGGGAGDKIGDIITGTNSGVLLNQGGGVQGDKIGDILFVTEVNTMFNMHK